MPMGCEVFASLTQDMRLVSRPETPSAPASEVVSLAEGGLVPPRHHSHPGAAQANGGPSNGPHGAQGEHAELTCSYIWPTGD